MDLLKKINDKLIVIFALALAVFQIYTAAVQFFPAMTQRSIHLGFGLAMIFLMYSKKKEGKGWITTAIYIINICLAILALIICFDVALNWMDMATGKRLVFPSTSDQIFGTMLIIMVLLATKYRAGWAMPIIGLVFVLYARFGNYIPIESLKHKGVAFTKIISMAHNCTEGIFSSTLGCSTEQIYIFLLFGSLLEVLGGGQFFLDIANCALGKVRGGSAKAAIFSSALFGSISGSAVANVAATGSITIPLMKKSGYDAKYSGAVVAVAATGGLIMPPVMGAAAFLMADTVGITYWEVCLAAFIPAILYYLALVFAVDLRAGAQGLKGVDPAEIPKIGTVMKRYSWVYIIPLFILIYTMAALKLPAYRSCIYSIYAMLLLALPQKEMRKALKENWMNILVDTSKSCLTAMIACACAGLILLGLQTSGLISKLSSVMIAIAHGKLILLLLLVALTSIILGMGLPAAACYILLAITAAPALVQMGVPKIAAHIFVLYFGSISAITPPVAMAAFAAGPIAKESSSKIGYCAFYISIPALLVAFCLAVQPELCLIGSLPSILLAIMFCVIGVFSMSVGLQGFLIYKLPVWRRVLWAVAGCCMILPERISSYIGIALTILLIVSDKNILMGFKKKTVEV